MPYKDPAKKKAYMREWNARHRKNGLILKKIKPFRLETTRDLTRVLERVIDEVMSEEIDAAVRGRCIAQLVGTAVKLLEIGGIEERLEALEAKNKREAYPTIV